MKRLLVCLALVAGCSGERPLGQEYVDRLENVLDTRAEKKELVLSAFPQPRELEVQQSSGVISIREFLSLRQCKLHTVLAHRNSLIGKLATPSQILFNDLDILASGPACVTKLENRALADKLNKYLENKRRDIGVSLWKAILGQSENRAFWGRTNPVNDYPDQLPREVIGSITALANFSNEVLAGNYQYTSSDYQSVEQHLGQLRHGDGGWLVYEMASLNLALQQADSLIQARLERPLCLQTQPSPAARIFQTVMLKFFIQQIQPFAVALNRREEQLMSAYRQLESPLLSFAPTSYRHWQEARETLISQSKQAARRHVEYVQKLYGQCGLTAGNPLS